MFAGKNDRSVIVRVNTVLPVFLFRETFDGNEWYEVDPNAKAFFKLFIRRQHRWLGLGNKDIVDSLAGNFLKGCSSCRHSGEKFCEI